MDVGVLAKRERCGTHCDTHSFFNRMSRRCLVPCSLLEDEGTQFVDELTAAARRGRRHLRAYSAAGYAPGSCFEMVPPVAFKASDATGRSSMPGSCFASSKRRMSTLRNTVP